MQKIQKEMWKDFLRSKRTISEFMFVSKKYFIKKHIEPIRYRVFFI
jgi:hypothetical protein